MPNPLADFLKPRPRRHVTLVGVLTDLRNRVGLVATNVTAALADTAHILRHLHEIKELTVARFDALDAKLDEQDAARTAAQERIAEDVRALQDQVAALELDTEDQAKVDEIVGRIQGNIDALNAIDPVRAADVPDDGGVDGDTGGDTGEEPQPA